MPYDTSWSIKLRKTYDQNEVRSTDDVNEMAEACLKANELVKVHGTPEMQAIMRVLLFQIGQEIARKQAES